MRRWIELYPSSSFSPYPTLLIPPLSTNLFFNFLPYILPAPLPPSFPHRPFPLFLFLFILPSSPFLPSSPPVSPSPRLLCSLPFLLPSPLPPPPFPPDINIVHPPPSPPPPPPPSTFSPPPIFSFTDSILSLHPFFHLLFFSPSLLSPLHPDSYSPHVGWACPLR